MEGWPRNHVQAGSRTWNGALSARLHEPSRSLRGIRTESVDGQIQKDPTSVRNLRQEGRRVEGRWRSSGRNQAQGNSKNQGDPRHERANLLTGSGNPRRRNNQIPEGRNRLLHNRKINQGSKEPRKGSSRIRRSVCRPRPLGLARLPQLAPQEIANRRPNGITSAVIDSSLDQLVNIVYELLRKLNGYDPQSNAGHR